MSKSTSGRTVKPESFSAVSRVRHSGLELVPRKKCKGKPATARDYAKIDWKPWTRGLDMRPGELIPSRETMDNLGISARLAYGVMLKSREELIETHKSMAHEDIDELMAHFFQAAEDFKSLARMIESAYARVLAAGTKHALARGKFKFRDGSVARAHPSSI